ncbi:MAG TPA: hypothetical protein VFE59_42595 [Trebonia sp.]|nr:hypothetical protein [Trebonia sp.]
MVSTAAGAVGGRAEQAEHGAQFADGGSPAGLNGTQGFGRIRTGSTGAVCGRRGLQNGAGRAGLHDHHAHVVGHDVVEFGGDPGPLGLDGAPGRGLVLSRRAAQPVGRVAQPQPELADAHRRGGRHRDDEDRRGVPARVLRQQDGCQCRGGGDRDK